MDDLQVGTFQNGVSYLKYGNGKKSLVIFPPTAALTMHIHKNPEKSIKMYKKLLPPGFSLYVLGYEESWPKNVSSFDVAKSFGEAINNNIGSTKIIAISYGGMVGIPFASMFPNLTQELHLVVTAYKMSEDGGVKFIRKIIQHAEKGDYYRVAQEINNIPSNILIRFISKMITWFRRKSLEERWNPLSTIKNAFKDVIEMEMKRKRILSEIKSPTYIFGGVKDRLFTPEIFKETQRLIPSAKLFLYKGAGHLLPLTRFRSFKRTIWQILEG